MKGVLAAAALLASGSAVAQQDWCGTDQHHHELMQDPINNSNYQDGLDRVDQILQDPGSSHHGSRMVRIVPVVVHVIYNTATSNISREQVQDGIAVLNEDFRRMNADSNDTRSVFQPYAADSEIEFRLAQLDPDGNCTDGITRTFSDLTNNAGNAVKGLVQWPEEKYLNIWVVNDIANGGGTGITLGYAQFPGSGNWNNYGIVQRHDRFGRIGTSNSDGRTLTHEVGHCFGLFHTFQSGCGGSCSTSGDRVCDTPPSSNSTFGCSQNQNTCSNDQVGPSVFTANVVDQIENYMSYDDCQNMFSLGQKDRMIATLGAFNQLISLTSAANHAATGVDGNDILCIADFESERRSICEGEQVTFIDQSYHGQSSWAWQFQSGSPAASNVVNPTVTYGEPGVYDVDLVVGNGNQTITVNKPAYLNVQSTPGQFLPYIESFETTTFTDGTWTIVNPDNNTTWEQYGNASFTGTYSTRLQNSSNPVAQTDELQSQTIDLSPFSTAEITFRVAYAQKATDNNDRLSLFASSDCGATWTLRWIGAGTSLATANPQTNSFTPSGPTQWENYIVTLPSSFLRENFRYRFEFLSDGGNNIFLDDINVNGTYKDFPVLVSPFDGAAGQASNVTLDWKAVGPIDSYELELDTTPNFNSSQLFTTTTTYISTNPNNSDTEYPATGLLLDQTYYWRVRTLTGGNQGTWSDVWEFKVSATGVGIDDPNRNLTGMTLFPNPTTGITNIKFSLKDAAEVSAEIYDLTGRTVSIVRSEASLSVGDHILPANIAGFAPGIYLVRVVAGDQQEVKRLILE